LVLLRGIRICVESDPPNLNSLVVIMFYLMTFNLEIREKEGPMALPF